MKELTGKERKDYIKGAIAEVLRVNKTCPYFTYFDYEQFSRFPYKGAQIRERTGLKLNDVKKLAGLKVRSQRGRAMHGKKTHVKTTTRNCNISSCEKEFEAPGDIHTCPSCTSAKGMTSQGMDERNPGSLGHYYKM